MEHVFITGKGVTGTEMEAIGLLERLVTRQASMLAYNHVFSLICILYLLSMPLVLLIKDPQRGMISQIDYKNWRVIWRSLWKAKERQ